MDPIIDTQDLVTDNFDPHLEFVNDAAEHLNIDIGSVIDKSEIAEYALEWVKEKKIDPKYVRTLVEYAAEFYRNHDMTVIAENKSKVKIEVGNINIEEGDVSISPPDTGCIEEEDLEKTADQELKEFLRVELETSDRLIEGTILEVNDLKPGDIDIAVLWDEPINGERVTEVHPQEIAILESAKGEHLETAKRIQSILKESKEEYDEAFKGDDKDRLQKALKDDYQKRVNDELSHPLVSALKSAVLSCVALRSDQDTRFNAKAWIEVWVDESDLEFEKTIQELKTSNIPIPERIAKAKEFARDMAIRMLGEISTSAIEINWDSVDIDNALDRINWERLVTWGELERADSMKILMNKIAQGGLDLLTMLDEESWYNHLKAKNYKSEVELKADFNWFYDSFNREFNKGVERDQDWLTRYNMFKRAFDHVARDKGFKEWKYGESQNDWEKP